jgi:hypothetical protein
MNDGASRSRPALAQVRVHLYSPRCRDGLGPTGASTAARPAFEQGLADVRFAVCGLGEAGSAVAADLAQAGAEVHVYDPCDVPTPGFCHSSRDGEGSGRQRRRRARADLWRRCRRRVDTGDPDLSGLSHIRRFSTASPAPVEMNRSAESAGNVFVDVALMAPVPGTDLRTPTLASGPGAARFEAIMTPLGMTVEVCGPEPGGATRRKLLRSVVMKGLACH